MVDSTEFAKHRTQQVKMEIIHVPGICSSSLPSPKKGKNLVSLAGAQNGSKKKTTAKILCSWGGSII